MEEPIIDMCGCEHNRCTCADNDTILQSYILYEFCIAVMIGGLALCGILSR